MRLEVCFSFSLEFVEIAAVCAKKILVGKLFAKFFSAFEELLVEDVFSKLFKFRIDFPVLVAFDLFLDIFDYPLENV